MNRKMQEIGPGIWYNLHATAKYCDDYRKPNLIVKNLKVTISKLPCQVCREEGQKFLRNHPPDDILFGFTLNQHRKRYDRFDRYNLKTRYPACHYLNLLHNYVNMRLGKPVYDLKASISLIEQECQTCTQVRGDS